MIFHELEHIIHVPWVIQAALLSGVLLMLAGVMVRRRAATADGGVMPDEGMSVRNLVEVLVEWLAGMAEDSLRAASSHLLDHSNLLDCSNRGDCMGQVPSSPGRDPVPMQNGERAFRGINLHHGEASPQQLQHRLGLSASVV